MPRKEFKKSAPGRDREIMQASDKVYEQEQLPEKDDKRQRELDGGKMWGASLGGEAALARVADAKISRLTSLTWGMTLGNPFLKPKAKPNVFTWMGVSGSIPPSFLVSI